MKKLYVGNLPFNATADELREMFTPYGRVLSATICSDRETGDSRGFAFVELAEGAEEAVQALHQAHFGGRTLTVNEAKPREGGVSAAGRTGAGRGSPRSY
ncbi:RNA recognition motif domain-containing protein [Gemmata sp.]|uniref:RNA recognition motif domain-containing protein n=1 Tax=Gemmata sp. TaxID=1914242 RepID=UPI003F71CBAD